MKKREPLLVSLVKLVDQIPEPAARAKRGPGRSKFYPDRLFLKALIIMIVRHLHRVNELLAVLAEPTYAMELLRMQLTQDGWYPCQGTWERRVQGMPESLPTQIGCLGRYLGAII